MQAQPHLYSAFPPPSSMTSSGRYSPGQYVRTAADMRRHCMTNPSAMGVSTIHVCRSLNYAV